MITFQDVLTWKSGGLRAFRSVLAKDARDLEQVHDESQRLFTDKFLGACAEAEARTRRALVDDVGDVYKQLERAAHDFLTAAEAVDEVAGKAKDLKRRADADGCNISDEGRVFIPDDRVPEEKVNETLEGELIMREADAILNALGLAYKVVEDLLERAKEASKAILSHGVAKPDPSWNVEEVNDWWTSLSPEEQQQIEVMHPDWVGNLGGVPFAVRDRANRRRIDPMLSDIDKRIAQLKKENYDKAHDPKSKGGTYDPDKHSELRILEEKRRDLLSVKRKFGGAPDGTHSLVSLDAFKGDHLWAAVGSGDIDNADHVAVHTPGMTATVESHLMGKGKGWGSGVSGVDNVLAQGEDILDRKGRNEQVAGITVLNYDAPRWGEIGTPNHSVAGNHQVEVGGKSGADMLYAVQATHSGDPHLVASGHSYGSSATGWALQHSTVADDAMFSGSPGLRR